MWFSLVVSVKVLPGSSEYCTGSGDPHSGGWQVHAGCWQEPSLSIHVDLFIGLLEYPYNMAAGFLQSK